MDIDISPVINALKAATPSALHGYLDQFEVSFEQKLWHQLTGQVEAFFADPAAAPFLIPVYRNFISKWEKKMNQFKFVQLSILASRQLEIPKAVQLLEEISEKVKTGGADNMPIFVMATMEAANYRLMMGDLVRTKQAIEECAKLAEDFVNVDPFVHASYFRVCAAYDKAVAAFSSYYKNALLYLACVDLDQVSQAEKVEIAHDLSVAALLGETTYNFGELLMHPVLDSLAGTPFAYLKDALLAFNSGDNVKFEALSPTLSKHGVLSSRMDFLKQKICLMSLVELAFKTIKESRQIPFSKISEASRVLLPQVEFLVMKALSLKLIRGSIDEVNQVLVIEWVQPRVLDREQIKSLQIGITEWQARVENITHLVHTLKPDIASYDV